MSMNNRDAKGKVYGGECRRKVCHNSDATWWNTSTHAWYCKLCAVLINRQNGVDLCVEVGEDEG